MIVALRCLVLVKQYHIVSNLTQYLQNDEDDSNDANIECKLVLNFTGQKTHSRTEGK